MVIKHDPRGGPKDADEMCQKSSTGALFQWFSMTDTGWWWLEPWNFMTFPIIIGNHHPNISQLTFTPWFFRGVAITSYDTNKTYIYISYIHPLKIIWKHPINSPNQPAGPQVRGCPEGFWEEGAMAQCSTSPRKIKTVLCQGWLGFNQNI